MSGGAAERGPGTTCTLTYDVGGLEHPVEGDLIATRTGTSYRVDSVRESPSRPGRFYLGVMRLERGAATIGQPGVWPLYWYRRERSRR